MAVRYYFVPETVIAGGGRNGNDLRRPAYVVEVGVTSWGSLDMGAEPTFLLAADVTPAQDAAISAGAGTVAIPAAIDNIPAGAALTQTKAALEGLNIPAGGWVDGLSYRQIVRIVACLFLFVQRWRGLGGGRIFGGGVTLDTTIAQLPAAAVTRLQAVADSFGYTYAGITGTSTLRDVLYTLGRQWGNQPIMLGIVTL